MTTTEDTTEEAGPRTTGMASEIFVVRLEMTGGLSTGVKSKGESVFAAPFNFNVLRALATVGTAPAGSALILNVSKVSQAAGASANLYTTTANRPTVADAATQSWTGSAAFVAPATPDVTAVLAGDILKLNVIQVGSGTAGSDVVLLLMCEKA